ncbi:hypothetical protein C772_01971 [Bhargavaea cecembensis DSE10]|uniref:DUF2971 domain-containing protein n=1 Tax=Bhargavaea cecembensis DSE10 TaxID=1235279 RepID=M7NFL3_9BACL|nr:hypothetical protein C772_01971 [Bhargavaea cecembensis DSE10]
MCVFINHRNWEVPDPDQPLWRYVDFTKFVDLLINRSLFFSRIDRFDDPFEGNPVSGFLESARRRGDWRGIEEFYEQKKMLKGLRKYSFVNSWHMNDYESVAMWNLYLQSDEGIAIRTTYRRLQDAFLDNRDVTAGVVKYVDFNEVEYSSDHLSDYLFLKRKSFEFENELRLFLLYDDIPDPEELKTIVRGPYEYGTNIGVDLSVLIESVYLSPTSPEWFEDLVRGLLAKFTDLDLPVCKSELGKLPR